MWHDYKRSFLIQLTLMKLAFMANRIRLSGIMPSRYGFVIVSKDDDFRQLSFLRGHPPKVIWLVVGNCSSNEIAELLFRSQTAISIFMDRTEDSILTLRSTVPPA